ncbi:hypothetical protein ABZ135_12560 [Streptomyces sp. NPDC006339]|uniref:hypothetical protein n=1 Tax=Streptomyces sp. NPDC006339 TaxID=3156755 RepID=UPI0033B25C11
MTPHEHHARAEELLARADTWMDADTGWKARLSTDERLAHRSADLTAAQVHATLATLLPILTPRSDAELTVYRAQHDAIPLGLYTNRAAARAHCEELLRRDISGGSLGWVPDHGGPDSPEDLVVVGPGGDEDGPDETVTGYVVTPLSVATAYDAEADE